VLLWRIREPAQSWRFEWSLLPTGWPKSWWAKPGGQARPEFERCEQTTKIMVAGRPSCLTCQAQRSILVLVCCLLAGWLASTSSCCSPKEAPRKPASGQTPAARGGIVVDSLLPPCLPLGCSNGRLLACLPACLQPDSGG